MSSKRVFITGIEGFTGRYLERYLCTLGYEVSGGALSPSAPNHVRLDLLDKDSIKAAFSAKFDYIIHLAAVSFTMADPAEIKNSNEIGTLNLLEALSTVKFEKAIFASSASVYGGGDIPMCENSPLNPQSVYAESKIYMEEQIIKSGLPFIIARPFNYTGAGQSENFLIPKIVRHFKDKASVIKLGNLTPKREYNDANDVVRIYAQLLELKANGEIFNIGSGKAYSIEQILQILRYLSGHDIAVQSDPRFIRANDPALLVCDTAKLQNYGIVPCNGEIEKLLRSML
ncbi:NAD-dependent epimerase/dehydratase family protein [uncultured Campylobacter sp.]|uniref:NAD-dependent epimerase/dehydratase family protein n=1 Tax=uncultured Campylobacter sp. TaxID=218934 RepID=UPI002614CA81|nr:NAD-dependent epimerase/dehydratase family protein [uncultured Campylobacter sp.]